MEEIDIHSLEELGMFAEHIAEEMLTGTTNVIALRGELGAGKTAFVQALAKVLGVEESVTSPTFLVMRQYPLPSNQLFEQLIHIDAYRVEEESEMAVLKLRTLVADPKNLIAIEWAEKIPSYIQSDALKMTITPHDDGSRTISYGIT